MGADMTAFIEWTNDANIFADCGGHLGQPRWDDDYIHGIQFFTDKEYDFFAAISGARNRFGRPSLFPLRPIPKRLSWFAKQFFEAYGEPECGGWLHLSEIDAAIEFVRGEDAFHTSFALDLPMDLMRRLVRRVHDEHVRLVFCIGSP